MKSMGFSVDSNAILLESISAITDARGVPVAGMCMGLDMIRRSLGEIGLCALRINDPELTGLLIKLCVLRQTKTGTALKVAKT